MLATKAGQDRAFKKLDTIKDDVLLGAEPAANADGEVMTSAYNGRISMQVTRRRILNCMGLATFLF